MMRTVRPGIAFALVLFGMVLVPAAAYAVLGDFGQPSSSPEPIGKAPTSVATGDFDDDGDNDLAVGFATGIAILLNDGKGGFSAAGTSPETVVGGPWNVVAGKFDADANLDLVVGSETDDVDDGRVTVLLGDGKGDFTAGSPISLKGAARDVAAADVDADNDLDIVVGEFFPARVAILRNDGSGSLAAPLFEDAGGTGTNVVAIATGDFSGDGEDDIVVGNQFTQEVTVYVNDGDEDGDFTEGEPVTAVAPISLATGSFDAGGALDVAVAQETSAGAVILLGNGSGGLGKAASSPETLPGPSHAIASADFNADGKTDLVALGNSNPGYAAILFGNGAGDFAPAPSSPEAVGAWPLAVAAVPLDAGSSPDLAVVNLHSDNLSVLLNDVAASPPTENPQQNPVTVPVTNLPLPNKSPVCAKTQTLKAGKCVRKKCPKGKKLKKNGRCVKKKPARSQRD